MRIISLTAVAALVLFSVLLTASGAKAVAAPSPGAAPLIERLQCSPTKVRTGGQVFCFASISGTITSHSWSAPRGSPSGGVGFVTSSVVCPPDPPGGPCTESGLIYGFQTTFGKPGRKTISLTACNGPACDTEWRKVLVRP